MGEPPARRAILLGPDAGNHNLSILRYFETCARRLPPQLPGWTLRASAPDQAGKARPLDRDSRLSRWHRNYLAWPLALLPMHADLIHIVDQGLAWYAACLRRPAKLLITVHDLMAYLAWKGRLPFPVPLLRLPLLASCIRQMRQADRIISVSAATAGDLMRELGIPAARITIVHNFIADVFSPLSPREHAAARQHFFPNAGYAVIHVGGPLPYKNRPGVLKAFAALRQRRVEANLYLVSGPPTVEEADLIREFGLEPAVSFLPPLPDSSLRQFYGAADVMLFPSFYEGFGLPPLEAMACGCPVICSGAGSLQEIAGGGALIADDPNDPKRLADLLVTVLTGHDASHELRRRGLDWVSKSFRESNQIAGIADVYRSLVP